ncbi:MAG TPA: hypothetical protein VJ385_22205, partial [Fibrobacteria bacterium]|nr:hypothetical protein [Fibrobacteria bacterium]
MAPKTIFILFTFALAMGIPRIASAAGGKGEAATNLEISLFVNGKPSSETWVNLSSDGSLIEIPAAPVLAALKSLVGRETFSALELQISAKGTLTNKVLARFGITLGINVQRQQVYLEARKNGAAAAPPPPAKAAKPVPVPSPGPSAAASPGPASPAADSGPWT